MTDPIRLRTTSIGHSTVNSIEVCGYDLTGELMGEVDFAAVFFLLISGRTPEPGESRLFNAILVALADHGLTPSALAARLTYTGAPEAVQGAVAAGLLGAGAVFLGVFEDAGRMLRAQSPTEDSDLDVLADRIVADHRGRRVPGLGHPTHVDGDPRTARLVQIAEQEGLLGPHTRLMLRVQARSGKPLPLNAGGVSGALLCDLGIDSAALRGVALVARSAGLVGHLVEESLVPLVRWLWDNADRETAYSPPN